MTATHSNANKVKLVIPDFAGGGAERAAVNLARALAGLGADVHFLVERPEGALAAEARETAPIEILGAKNLPINIAVLRKRMCDDNDTVFISFMTRSNIMCSIARLFLARRPLLILTEHNNRQRLLAEMSTCRRALSYAMLMFSFHGADTVVCVSEGILSITRKLFFMRPEKLARIYNPIVTTETARITGDNPRSKTKNTPILIVSAGRLHKQKDFPTLIRAAARLREWMNFQLIIFGEGPERAELERLAESLDLRDIVSFPGFRKDILSAIRKADLFVLSSAWEGFGNVLAEALACGTPVVSTDCESGPREILADGKFGRLTPVGDAEALAAAMHETLAAPRNVPAIASERFSAETIAREYLLMINGLKASQL